MAMSVVYTTVNGRILRENRGGVVHNFIPDPLGSVVMVRDTSGNTVYEAEYSPYGDVQSETGTNPSEFGYVGTLGYVKDSASSLYVRARYLLTNLGRWLTKDPLWPSEPGYVYAGAAPNTWVDPLGLACSDDESSDEPDYCWQVLFAAIPAALEDKAKDCLKQRSVPRMLACLRKLAKGLKGTAGDLFKDGIWAWLACTMGSLLEGGTPGTNPCGSVKYDCINCCGGTYEACAMRCDLDRNGWDLFGIGWAACKESCRHRSTICVAQCY